MNNIMTNHDEEKNKKIGDKFQVKRQQVTPNKDIPTTIKGADGRDHKATERQFTEAEVDDTHLVKIAPMFYFSPDSNRILLIPFSIKFTVFEILQLCARVAHNIETQLDTIQKLHKNKIELEQALKEKELKEQEAPKKEEN